MGKARKFVGEARFGSVGFAHEFLGLAHGFWNQTEARKFVGPYKKIVGKTRFDGFGLAHEFWDLGPWTLPTNSINI